MRCKNCGWPNKPNETTCVKYLLLRKSSIIVLLLLSFSFFSCQKGCWFNKSHSLCVSLVNPDDSVCLLLGDSVCKVLFQPVQVEMFALDVTTPFENEKVIAGYVIKRKMGTVNKDYYTSLLFLLSDISSYNQSNLVKATPFLPHFALQFKLKKDNLIALFSLNSQDVKFVFNGNDVGIYRYNYSQLFTLFFQKMSQSDSKDKSLIIKL